MYISYLITHFHNDLIVFYSCQSFNMIIDSKKRNNAKNKTNSVEYFNWKEYTYVQL